MILCLLLLFAQSTASESSPLSRINSQTVIEHPDVRPLLQSSDASQQAWGAWHAGQRHIHSSIPLLVMLVEKRLPDMDWKPDGVPPDDLYSRSVAARGAALAVDAGLDALIQLEAKVPVDLISAIYQKRPAQALILLSKLDSEADPFLLNLAGREQGLKWYCAANMLLSHRTRGFAFLLLKNLSIKAIIAVSEDGSQSADRGGIGGGGSGGGGGPSIHPPEYPPHAYYYLSLGGMTGNMLLASGPTVSIYYGRDVTPSGAGIFERVLDIQGPSSEDRLEYISALGNFRGRMPLSAAEHRSVQWTGRKSLQSEKERFRQEILSHYRVLVRNLIEERLLSKNEASILPKPTIRMQVHDLRSSAKH